MKKIAILGVSGSIGKQSVDVIRQHQDLYSLVAASVNTSVKYLEELLKYLKFILECNNNRKIISEEFLCIIIKLLDNRKISRNVAKELLAKTIASKENPMEIANREHLIETITNETIIGIIDGVLAEKPDLKDQYKVEPDKITNFIVGAVMKQTKGKADATFVKDYVSKIMK